MFVRCLGGRVGSLDLRAGFVFYGGFLLIEEVQWIFRRTGFFLFNSGRGVRVWRGGLLLFVICVAWVDLVVGCKDV